jgi:large subunit ribosomal protein L31
LKAKIHPNYQAATFTCTCGNVIETYSTTKSSSIEICSNCHPFYTGKQKLIDSAGRVERFRAKYAGKPVSTGKKKSKEK